MTEPNLQRAMTRRPNRRSSLPPKTLAGFVAAVVAVLAIWVISQQNQQSRTEGVQSIIRMLEATQHLEALLSTLKDAETGQRGYMLTGEDAYLEPYTAAVVALPRELERVRVALGDDAAQLERLEAVDRLSVQKLAELEETIALQRAGKRDAALELMLSGRGRELMVRLRGLVGEIKAAGREQLELRMQEWRRAAAASLVVISAGSGLLLFLIVAAGYLSSRDFREQQVEAWIRAGQTELGHAMQGEHDLQRLGDSVAAFLARFLGAEVGVVHKLAEDGRLWRVGAYGLPDASPRDSGAEPSLGLTRRALSEGTVLHVTDVPDDYFPVTSGLGGSRPRHLALAPTRADGRANAVVELGFFRPIEPSELELLRRVAEPLGVALRSAKLRSELRNLLEETQRQAEELQSQQEELRVSNEELEQQSRTLQDSQGRLENQQAELEQINAQLEEQAETLSRQRDELFRAKAETERASAYKSEFLANMSHELRTPLNSSLILAKLLVDNKDGNLTPEQVKFAQTIYSAGNDLLTLINDILDLSRIEAGKLDVRFEDVAPARLCDDLVRGLRPIAQDKRLGLDVVVEPGTPATIHTDPTRLQQILKNLLSNALKFTERGSVALHVRAAEGGRVAFEVRDTGIGIAPEQHAVIFEAFRQADGTTNRKYGGTGLGLSISRDLARLLGGEITVDSAPGRGSTFTLVLPERHVASEDAVIPPRAAVQASPTVPAKAGRGASARAPARVSTPIDDRERVTPGFRSILVIEDDLEFAAIVRDLARDLQFLVLLAPTAEEGLSLAVQHRPSAIVLDVGLPDRSGLSVLDALKREPATRHIPVHIVSAADHTQAALEMGAAGYAIKPIAREELAAALERLEAKFTQKLRRVLVVEDDEVHRESTCRLLEAEDVETVAVGTAAAALDRLGSATFDCMVLDLSLPDRPGLQLLEEMAGKESYAFPPVIVYTGRSLSRDDEQQLRRFSSSIIIKGARSPERLLDEVTLFLHQVEERLPPDRQRMLRDVRNRDAAFEGRRVLVVEDDVRNIFAITHVLEPKGAKVEIARNGREALEHLASHPGVDLVLMDIMMPEMDGLEATREIRKQPQLAKLPIIALTAKAMADDRESCLAAGANDYIAKPLDVDKLLSLARVWMPK
jgi:CheY-like chemotaxis protein/CHASE3 domain sensor protein